MKTKLKHKFNILTFPQMLVKPGLARSETDNILPILEATLGLSGIGLEVPVV